MGLIAKPGCLYRIRSDTKIIISMSLSSIPGPTHFYDIVSLRHFRLEMGVEVENFDAALVNLVDNNVFLVEVVQIHVMDHIMAF